MASLGFDMARFERDGFAIVENAVPLGHVETLRRAFAELPPGEPVRRRESVYGVRNCLTTCPPVSELARSDEIRGLAQRVLGAKCFAVRALFFDKPPDANWRAPWHQDLSIAVKREIPTEGFGPWSVKAGIPHVQPPALVLARMLTIRVHLDPCDAANGALEVLPGAHTRGKLSHKEILALRESIEPVVCEVGLGGVALMRPLLPHSSRPADAPHHRRVVHIEFAADELPGRLDWYERVM